MTELVNAIFIGIDAGGTQTRSVCMRGTGELLGFGVSGSLNHRSRAKARAIIDDAIGQAITFHKSYLPLPVAATFIGSAAVEAPASESDARALLPKMIDSQTVFLDTDTYIAWAGAFFCQPGIVLVAGTGSMCLGIDAEGKRLKIGGWGWRVSDEGSAYAIAIEAMRAALRTMEGRAEAHQLWQALLDFIAVSSKQKRLKDNSLLHAVKTWIYHSRRHPADFAAFASSVGRCAENGCLTSQGILQQAGKDLAAMVEHIAYRFSSNLVPAVATAGSVIRKNPFVYNAFKNQLFQHPKKLFDIQDALFSPEVGAALLAIKARGLELNPRLLGQLKAQISQANSRYAVISGP